MSTVQPPAVSLRALSQSPGVNNTTGHACKTEEVGGLGCLKEQQANMEKDTAFDCRLSFSGCQKQQDLLVFHDN